MVVVEVEIGQPEEEGEACLDQPLEVAAGYLVAGDPLQDLSQEVTAGHLELVFWAPDVHREGFLVEEGVFVD